MLAAIESGQEIGHWDEAFLGDDWGHRLYSGSLLIGDPRANFNLACIVHALNKEEVVPFIEIPFIPSVYSPIPGDFLFLETSTYSRDQRMGNANMRELRRQGLLGDSTPSAQDIKRAVPQVLRPFAQGLRLLDKIDGPRISHGLMQEEYPYNKDLYYRIVLNKLEVNQDGDGWFRYPKYPVLTMAKEVWQQSRQKIRLFPQPL